VLSPALGTLKKDRWTMLSGQNPPVFATAHAPHSSHHQSPSSHNGGGHDAGTPTPYAAYSAMEATSPIRCAVLPDSDPALPCAGVFQYQPDHPVFQIHEVNELYEFLKANFPQVWLL
jgi:hypothetical protein